MERREFVTYKIKPSTRFRLFLVGPNWFLFLFVSCCRRLNKDFEFLNNHSLRRQSAYETFVIGLAYVSVL